MKLISAVYAVAMFASLAMACHACGLSTGQQVASVEGAANLVICIFEHYQEPPERIAILCGAASIADVQKILDAHRKAEIREGFSRCAPDAGK